MDETPLRGPHELAPGRYRHYKGPEYLVLGTARHSETDETLVVYRPLVTKDYDGVWVRPLAMFTEPVDVGGRTVPRFAPLEGE
jgi:hypothetical protein